MTRTEVLITSARTSLTGARLVAVRLSRLVGHPHPSRMCRSGAPTAVIGLTKPFAPRIAPHGASAEL